MTFSLVARCPKSGQFGIAISSSSPAVAARCAHVRAGVGAVVTQNVTDPRLGPAALALLADGLAAPSALETLGRSADLAHRQLAAIDAAGRTAVFTGAAALGVHATTQGRDAAAAGNLLASRDVVSVMVSTFERTQGELGDRLIVALGAGRDAGGEAGPVRSAGLLVVGAVAWPITDLRVDWDEGDPIARLAALWRLWKPQAQAYVQRALDPGAAPSYGVPGDE